MKSYTTKNALKTVVENFRKPRQLFMYHPIKFEINETFPATKTSLFSKRVNGTTYWLANTNNIYERDRQIFTHDGKFRESDFLSIFEEFCKRFPIFHTPSSTMAEQCYSKAIEKYMKKNKISANVKKTSTHFFAMNEIQMFKYRNYNDRELPRGYSIDQPDLVDDVRFLVGTSNDSKIIEFEKEKLRRFPSLFVRKNDQVAGYICSETNGALANLLVFNKHRGKNLGEKLEIEAAKIAINSGIRPCKFIETSNEFYLNKTKKSKLMDVVESNGIPIVVDQNVYVPEVELNSI